MNRIKSFLIFLLLALAGIVLFIMTIITLLPDDLSEDLLRGFLEKRVNLSFEAKGFKKIFPFGFEADHVVVTPLSIKTSAVYFDKIHINLRGLYLLMGQVRVDMDGSIGGGLINSAFRIKKGGIDLDMKVYGINIKALPYLEDAGVRGSGAVSGDIRLNLSDNKHCPDGSINLTGENVDISGIKILGPSLIFKERVKVSLDAAVKDCRARLNGLWVEGGGVSSKLYGNIHMADDILKSDADLTLEIILERERAKGDALWTILSGYRKSSNYYSMRIKGALGNPGLMP